MILFRILFSLIWFLVRSIILAFAIRGGMAVVEDLHEAGFFDEDEDDPYPRDRSESDNIVDIDWS